MKFLLPLFFSTVFFLATSLFGRVAVTENEPSALVEGIVNVITGDLYALEDDIIIQAAEPIRLRRSYISNGGEPLAFLTQSCEGGSFLRRTFVASYLFLFFGKQVFLLSNPSKEALASVCEFNKQWGAESPTQT
jgi:hypothetical protein